MEKIQSLLNREIVRSFLLNEDADANNEFKFDEPKVRGPRRAVTPDPEMEPPVKTAKLNANANAPASVSVTATSKFLFSVVRNNFNLF